MNKKNSKNNTIQKKMPSAVAKMKSIQEVHDYYQKIISCMPNNVYWLDENCITQGCNDNVLKFIGLENINDFIGLTYENMGKIAGWKEGHADLYKKDDLEVMSSGIAKLNIEDPPLYDEKGNPTYYLTSRVPIYDDKHEKVIGVVGISVDISKQKKTEKLLRKAKNQAEEASRAKSEFIANMSHDLRTPLSGIVGMSEILQNHENDPDNAQYAMWIHDCSHQLLSLLNGILDIVKLGNAKENEIKITSFDFRQCIDELAQLEMPTVKLKGLDLLIEIDENIPQFIQTDRIKIHRTILNLLGNAIKFTQKGHVAINVKLMNQTKDKVTLYFAVSDTGIGIPEDQQAQVFDRFHRVNESFKGTYSGHGIGLHIAQSYVKCLGGDIQLSSEPDVGTSCYFELTFKIGKKEEATDSPPALSDTNKLNASIATDNAERTPVVKERSESAPKLLIIEDNLVARRTFEQLAINAGCSVLSAENGTDGIELAKTNDLDLIITDIGLPDISGYDVCRQIREWEKRQNKSSPIIGLTAHAKEDSQQESAQSGMNDIFSKPICNPLLQTMLEFIEPEKETFNKSAQNDSIQTPTKKGTLGQDLPETEDDLFKINDYPLIDIEYAVSIMGNEQMVREILPLMMADETQNDINAIKDAYEKEDWDKVEKLAHKMKGGAVNCGAIRMKYACLYLERYRKAGYRQLLDSLYQQLIKVVDETQCHIKEWLKN